MDIFYHICRHNEILLILLVLKLVFQGKEFCLQIKTVNFFFHYFVVYKCFESGCADSINTSKPVQKSRDITWPTKVCLVKARLLVFLVVMYGYESWTIKKAECQRIDAFELWCWRGLLRVPWTARRSNQSILKEISPEYSLEELMLKLKLQYFGAETPILSPGVKN